MKKVASLVMLIMILSLLGNLALAQRTVPKDLGREAFDAADKRLAELMDIQYVDAGTDDNGTITVVAVSPVMKKNPNSRFAEQAKPRVRIPR